MSHSQCLSSTPLEWGEYAECRQSWKTTARALRTAQSAFSIPEPLSPSVLRKREELWGRECPVGGSRRSSAGRRRVVGGSLAGKSRLEQQIPNVKSITDRWPYFGNFYMTLRVFPFQNALFIFVGLRLVVLIAETFERQGILFILLTLYYA